MKFGRKDYDRRRHWRSMPAGEPVFILRGQDICAPGVVRHWADIAEINGAKPDIVDAARQQAERMENWQSEIRKKIPDLPETIEGIK